MKTMKRLLERVPRRVSVFFDLLLAAALLLGCYFAVGAPASEETAFRRAEKANMLGPSRLLDRINVPDAVGYSALYLADDGDGVIFYTILSGGSGSSMDGVLRYREKTDGLLLAPLPCDDGSIIGRRDLRTVRLVLVDDVPEADRAALRLTLPTGFVFSADAPRADAGGYFLFEIPLPEDFWYGPDAEAMRALLRTNTIYSSSGMEAFPAELTFYRGEDVLRTARHFVRSRSADGSQ